MTRLRVEFGSVIGTYQEALLTGKLQTPAAVQRQTTVRAAVDEYAVARRGRNENVGAAIRCHVARSALISRLSANSLWNAVCGHASIPRRVSLVGVRGAWERRRG